MMGVLHERRSCLEPSFWESKPRAPSTNHGLTNGLFVRPWYKPMKKFESDQSADHSTVCGPNHGPWLIYVAAPTISLKYALLPFFLIWAVQIDSQQNIELL